MNRMLVPFLFFCSGATALVYEVIWARHLSLMFGSTIQAQTIVLAVFMGGLALGNRLFGSRADLMRQPLAVYGYLEIAIGLYAFAFEWLHALGDFIFVAAGTPLLERGAALLALKVLLSVLLLLGPTVLMGGTLPLLAAWLQKQSGDPGRLSARFYSLNSLGAVLGAGLAGFFLVRSLGMLASLQLTAMANVLIGVAALGLARRHSATPRDDPPAEVVATNSQAAPLPAAFRWAVLLVMLTGGVAMGLEVLASRSLALLFGASLQAFAIVLMAFILGIGLGSAAVASPRLKRWRGQETILCLLLGTALFLGLLVAGIEQWVEIYRQARTGFARSSVGYQFHQLFIGLVSLVILGIPAAMLGAVLPLCIRVAGGTRADLGRAVGRLLTFNTLGAVGGVLLTGFVLMPQAGLRNSFVILALVLCSAAMLLAWVERKKVFVLVAGGGVACGVALLAVADDGWQHVFSSGIFRAREVEARADFFPERRANTQILFYEDAADATVSVECSVANTNSIALRINGKPDASSDGDLSTQLLLAHLPMLMRPGSTDVFVLGLGSGITGGALLDYPVEQVTIAENCAPVIRAASYFTRWNGAVLSDRRVRILREDARTLLKLDSRQYDVLISEPSNPWTAGIGSVFSREFYELAASRMKPGGLMVQWLHVYESHDEIISLILRTFQQVFPHLEIWDASEGDILLIGGLEPWRSTPEVYRAGFEIEAVRHSLERIGLGTPGALWARQLASQETASAIAGGGPVQSDAFPVLEYSAPQAFYIGGAANRLFKFDERTLQSDLASEEKRRTLAALDNEQLRRAFQYLSANTQLRAYLKWRLDATREEAPMRLAAPIPSIFQPANLVILPEAVPPGAPEALKRLTQAKALLHSNPEDGREAVQTISAELKALQPGSLTAEQISHFAVWAARAGLRYGDFITARELLLLGMERDDAEPELNYLARILEMRQAQPVKEARR